VRQIYARWDQRDPEIVKLWEETCQWSLDGFSEMYEQLISASTGCMVNYGGNTQARKWSRICLKKGSPDERPEGPVVSRSTSCWVWRMKIPCQRWCCAR
jgi:arginyl-tRNA synthetase